MAEVEDRVIGWALGLAFVAGVVAWWRKKGGDLGISQAAHDFAEAATYEGSLPQDAPGIGGAEAAFGAVARALGFEEGPSVGDRADRPADERAGPFLGTPRNVERVAGKVRYPNPGQVLDLSWGTSTLNADGAIENQANERRLGQVRARMIETKGSEQRESYVDGPYVDLAPGEFREITMRVEFPFSGYWTDPDRSEISLQWAGHTLDTVQFRRT